MFVWSDISGDDVELIYCRCDSEGGVNRRCINVEGITRSFSSPAYAIMKVFTWKGVGVEILGTVSGVE